MKWIAVALALLIVALAFNLGLLVYAIYGLGLILLVTWRVSSRWSSQVSLERTISGRTARIGNELEIRMQVRNAGTWPIAWMLVEDIVPLHTSGRNVPAVGIAGDQTAVLQFAAGQTHELHYTITCLRRGYLQVGPTVVETGDMFGFHRKFKVASEPFFVTVYPKVVPLAGYDIASRRPIGEVILANRLFEDPTRILGVRDYEPGDPLNRIHWKKTASTGQLQCKLFEPSSLSGATIVLDFHASSFDPAHEPYRSELAVSAAASIACALSDIGQQVGLVSNGRDAADRIRQEGWQGDERTRRGAQTSVSMLSRSERLEPVQVPTRKSPEQQLKILQALARLEISDGMEFSELLTETASQLPRDATIVAIVSGLNLETAVALGSLKQQGYSVAAIINTFSEERFLQTTSPMVAQHLQVMHLKDEESIHTICEKQALLHQSF